MRRLRYILLYILLFAPGPAPALADAVEAPQDRLETLYGDLREADPEDWPAIADEIYRIESRSGSAAMDLLLQRGEAAVSAGDLGAALEHFSALVDHAPDFAEGYAARASVWYALGEYGLAVADIGQTLARNPRHYTALSGLGLILEETGNPAGALRAYRAAQAIHPWLDTVNEAIRRLESTQAGQEL